MNKKNKFVSSENRKVKSESELFNPDFQMNMNLLQMIKIKKSKHEYILFKEMEQAMKNSNSDQKVIYIILSDIFFESTKKQELSKLEPFKEKIKKNELFIFQRYQEINYEILKKNPLEINMKLEILNVSNQVKIEEITHKKSDFCEFHDFLVFYKQKTRILNLIIFHQKTEKYFFFELITLNFLLDHFIKFFNSLSITWKKILFTRGFIIKENDNFDYIEKKFNKEKNSDAIKEQIEFETLELCNF